MVCSNCNESFNEAIKFCSKCGLNLLEENAKEHASYITKSIVFYLGFIAYLVLYYIVSPDFLTLESALLLDGSFAILILLFCVIDFKNVIRLFRWPKINIQTYLFIIVFPVLSAFVFSYSMDFLNELIFDEPTDNVFFLYAAFENSIFWSFVFISLVPAVFEELGFRGYLFNQLLNITSPNVTIIITAFLFALMHFSFISIIWIFFFGLALGYLRLKYKTIWLGMIVHFIHNSIVLLIDMQTFFF